MLGFRAAKHLPQRDGVFDSIAAEVIIEVDVCLTCPAPDLRGQSAQFLVSVVRCIELSPAVESQVNEGRGYCFIVRVAVGALCYAPCYVAGMQQREKIIIDK